MAALTGGDKCIKYLLFTFNFIFWLAGTAVLAIGLWLRFDPRTKSLFEGEDSPSVFFTGKRRVPSRSGVCVVTMGTGFTLPLSENLPKGETNTSVDKEGVAIYTNQRETRLSSLNCCGASSPSPDWMKDTCPKKEGLEQYITTSCPSAITDIFNSKLHIIGGVGIGIGVIMIFGMIFSMMLCCAIKRSQEVV
nr:CD9 antigen-like [Paramormyrops kingsleyae]